MALDCTNVAKTLNKKIRIAGFEIPDLLLVFLVLALLNFLFGKSDLKLFLVWLPPLALAASLRVFKIGKEENYIVHLLRHKLSPKYLTPFDKPRMYEPKSKRRQGDKIKC